MDQEEVCQDNVGAVEKKEGIDTFCARKLKRHIHYKQENISQML